jgi:hypothetical protein
VFDSGRTISILNIRSIRGNRNLTRIHCSSDAYLRDALAINVLGPRYIVVFQGEVK